jgi:predicted GH43/DUF377 family glycosyl hydrolase
VKKQTLFQLFFLVIGSLFDLHAVHDLAALKQNYILETEQIEISEYPTAFNPSMIRWNDAILFSFRIRDPITDRADAFGLIVLDENFNRISDPQILKIPKNAQFQDNWIQDPRLVECNNEIYMAFNDITLLPDGTYNRRMFYTKLYWNGNKFFAESPECLLFFENENPNRQEKNWVPFIYNEKLLLSYNIFPHTTIHPIPGTDWCETFSKSPFKLNWDWGVIRGGTPALRVDDEYLAFFHSCKYMATKQSNDVPMHHYFMGAYTFSDKPPFRVTGMTAKPIVANSFYTGTMYQTWEPLRCVFPGGYIFDERFIWVCYGRQDNEMWIVKMNKNELLNSLKPL